MTIAAAYLTSEGIVFGTDSTTTISTPHGVAQLFNYAQKIFEVGENSRFGVATWGAGSLQGVSHRTLIAKLAHEADLEKLKVRDAANLFKKIITEKYTDGKNIGGLGYLLGGWDPDTHLPECYRIVFDIQEPQPEWIPLNVGDAMFFGYPDFFSRVFYGYDSNLPGRILDELRKMELGIEESKIKDAFQKAFEKAVAPLAAAGFRDLPIREAIDFVYTYLHITVKAFKFRFGPPICGGPIEIAFISTDRKFRWVLHKDFARAIYEQEA